MSKKAYQEKKVKDFVKYFEDRDQKVLVIAQAERGFLFHGYGTNEFIVFWCTKIINLIMNGEVTFSPTLKPVKKKTEKTKKNENNEKKDLTKK